MIPKSKIIIIGGSDEVCKAVYDADCYEQVVHLDSQIDTKAKFKI